MTAPDTPSFGELLRDHRREAELTQEELAERAGISRRAVSDLERGLYQRPHRDTVRLLARALSLTAEEEKTFLDIARRGEARTRGAASRMADDHDGALESPSPAVRVFLIADVRGYTRYTEQNGDEAAARLATRFAQVVEEEVTPFEGEVVELRGDEALVAFTSARNALRAAIHLQHRFKNEVLTQPSLPLYVGIGLDGGEAVPVQGGYRGGALNLAARLCSIAATGEVFASESVVHLARHMDAYVYLDRGQVKLKGVAEPVRVVQIVPESEAQEERTRYTVDPTAAIRLPVQPNPFIGRERELRVVTGALLREDIRLLTLTGTGGTGKTRLGLEAAREVAVNFPDGVYFVNLAPLADPQLVVPAIAETLGVKEVPEESLIETMTRALRDRQLLLMLDNFEHLLAAAPVVSELLTGCPGLTVLVTSRAALHLSAEHEYAVRPLSLPDLRKLPELGALSQYDAVALFIQRALAVKSDFQVSNQNAPAVAEICSRLDGLPLAIELAAARLKLFPPQVLLSRLQRRLPLLTGGSSDLPARHQTLRATIDWSYSLLSEEEQRLFARLSVFAGGCTIEAAEAVCNSEEDRGLDVLEGIASLVDKSLLRGAEEEEPRFSMLETIREYAAERLSESGEEAEIFAAHARYYLALAEEAESELLGSDQQLWVERLLGEHDNLRSALRWSLDSGNVETALRLVAALWRFWSFRVYYTEGLRWVDEALKHREKAAPELVGRVLLGAGEIAAYAVDLERAVALNEESLELHRRLGDKHGMAAALNFLAIGLLGVDVQDRRGLSYFRESLELSRQTDDVRFTAEVMGNLGLCLIEQGNIEEGRRLNEQSLGILVDAGDLRGASRVYENLARVAFYSSDFAAAAGLWSDGLLLLRERSDPRTIIFHLVGLAAVAAQSGDISRAATLAGASTAIRAATGSPTFADEAEFYDRYVEMPRTRANPELWEPAWSEGQAMSMEQALAYALDETD